MAITWTHVTNLDASLVTVPVAQQNTILAYVSTLPLGRWGVRLELAQTFLAAHMATFAARGAGGVTGAVISESLGDAAKAYATPTGVGGYGDYASTTWGMIYWRMVRSLGVVAIVG